LAAPLPFFFDASPFFLIAVFFFPFADAGVVAFRFLVCELWLAEPVFLFFGVLT